MLKILSIYMFFYIRLNAHLAQSLIASSRNSSLSSLLFASPIFSMNDEISKASATRALHISDSFSGSFKVILLPAHCSIMGLGFALSSKMVTALIKDEAAESSLLHLIYIINSFIVPFIFIFISRCHLVNEILQAG